MIIKVKNISKSYQKTGRGVLALDDISFEINEGDFVTITGQSGSGKTTLLLSLAGLIKITGGQIHFNNFRIDNANDKYLSDFRKKYVGFVMQSFALIPYLTALENIMLPLAISKISKKEKIKKANTLIELVGLEDRIYHFPRELSAGQQQRIAIARALINEPSLILADEPTGNLDPSLSTDIMNLLKKINNEKHVTILMVTHSPVAAEYGSKKIHLHDGKIISY
ncbi:MAG: ABC transporter ATP-binding protein YtrE [Bacteroidetes bacterium ADurb.Bin234]|nr:MAG: ABC transporter ATP-binding protein YtrE [Bacteroidetes bacterium ADurb.Bin234]